MRDTFDVVVIGLGPAGACAAAAAARRGCAVLALDRKRRPGTPVQCAELVPALLDVEARHLLECTRQRIRSMHTFVEQESPDVEPHFPGYMVDRAALDGALAADAARAGALCRYATSARLLPRAGGVELGDGRQISARVIVGADGPRSGVGRHIGQRNRELIETRQITVPLLSRHEGTDIFLSGDIPGGYGWLFPKGEVAHIGAGVAASQRRRLKDIVQALHARLVSSGRVGGRVLARTGGAIPAGGMLKPWGTLGANLALLAGDAAGLANPVTGAGIAAAVLSGSLAGEAAAAWLAGDGEAGAGYEDELRGIFQAALERALMRRREITAQSERGARPAAAALRRGWVAYPEYWSH